MAQSRGGSGSRGTGKSCWRGPRCDGEGTRGAKRRQEHARQPPQKIPSVSFPTPGGRNVGTKY